jgi:hypothetical protein
MPHTLALMQARALALQMRAERLATESANKATRCEAALVSRAARHAQRWLGEPRGGGRERLTAIETGLVLQENRLTVLERSVRAADPDGTTRDG